MMRWDCISDFVSQVAGLINVYNSLFDMNAILFCYNNNNKKKRIQKILKNLSKLLHKNKKIKYKLKIKLNYQIQSRVENASSLTLVASW